MKLTDLHENYIRNAERPMFDSHDVPITVAIDPSKPLIAIERWAKINNCLQKKFIFISSELRNKWLGFIFEYESAVGHHATLLVNHEHVFVRLQTNDIQKITELDKEFARFADSAYKDVLYNIL